MTFPRRHCVDATTIAILACMTIASATRIGHAESNKHCVARTIGGIGEDGLPASLLAAESALMAADEKLDQARQAVVDATEEMKRINTGLSNQTFADGEKRLKDAQNSLEEALEGDKTALADYECVRDRLMAARTWRYGIVAGGHVAQDARGLGKGGLQLQWIWHPYQLFLRQESITTIRWSYMNPSGTAHQHWAELIQRLGIPFGSMGTLAFGLGAGFQVNGHDQFVDRLAITGDVGLGFRGGQWLRYFGSSFVSEARLFMQPWLPCDGSPATFFFGIEFGLGGAWSQVGDPNDLKLGRELVHPPVKKPPAK